MDYGIRLFRHVMAQVFGNLGQAAKISAVPIILFAGCAALLGAQSFGNLSSFSGTISMEEYEARFGEGSFAQLMRLLWLLPIGIVVFAWVAVAWHRYVLTEEHSGVIPQFAASRVLGYVGRWLLIVLLLIISLIPVAIVVGIVLGVSGQSNSFFLNTALSFLASWVLVRWSLILPAWSVDRRMTIGESWKTTSEVSGEILVPILAFALIFPAIFLILGLIPLGIVALPAAFFVFWIQMLVNLALLTTLYGNLAEGRELN